MTQAVIYTRFSPRPNAKKCDSCQKQADRCVAYCDGMEYVVISVLADEGVSGGDWNRPGIVRALNYLGETRDRVLVVDSPDRLARDVLVALTIKHEVEKAGGQIEYANGTPPDTTPEGELFGTILAAFAQYERSRIRARTSAGIKKRQAKGEFFGKPPVGYMRDPDDSKKLIPDEIERDAVSRAQYLSGTMASDDIAKTLTLEYGRFRGNPWSARTVRKMLKKKHDWEV